MISSDRPEQHRAKSRCVSKPVPSTAEGEHNLDVIKTADWVLDLGPGGGVNGGEIVAEGTPEKVAAEPKSFTGQYLRPLLERSLRSPAQAGVQPVKKNRHKASSSEDQPDLIAAK